MHFIYHSSRCRNLHYLLITLFYRHNKINERTAYIVGKRSCLRNNLLPTNQLQLAQSDIYLTAYRQNVSNR